jgi:cytochrome b6
MESPVVKIGFLEKSKSFIVSRSGLNYLTDFLSKKTVPHHKFTFWYLFGGLTLFFFVIQLITGVLLLIYYSPTPATANESVHFIVEQVPFGWLIRSIHHWSSHLMIAVMLIHVFSTFFMRAYRKPREIIWMSGVAQLFIVLAFGFTGYLLPWDDIGYFATQIGTEVARSVPYLGEFLVRLLGVNGFVGDESFKRFFALHVSILPLISLMVIAVHIILTQLHGTSTPDKVETKGNDYRFYPNFLYRDLMMWIVGFFVLLALTLLFPAAIGTKAEPYSSAPAGIKPEWYFLPLYQTLRMVPSSVLGISGEVLINTGVAFFSLMLFLVPLIDSTEVMNARTRILRATGIVVVLYMFLTIVLAYTT